MSATTIKLAAIGSGAWGRNIVRTLHQMGALAVVAEAAPHLREQLATDYPGMEVVSDYADLFARADIPAVTIATPAATHHRIAKDCLLAGKDVFVEKPMTLTAAESEDLVATAEQHGRILMVGHLLLYKPAVEFIREHISEPINIKDVAQHFSIARRTLERRFRTAMKISLHDFQTNERIARAEDLLRAEPPLTLAEVARRCGFVSATRLNLVFRRVKGASPAEWRTVAK